jgi:hypothetical protein
MRAPLMLRRMKSFVVYLQGGKEVQIESDKVVSKGHYLTFYSKEKIIGIFSFANICGFTCTGGEKAPLIVGEPS